MRRGKLLVFGGSLLPGATSLALAANGRTRQERPTQECWTSPFHIVLQRWAWQRMSSGKVWLELQHALRASRRATQRQGVPPKTTPRSFILLLPAFELFQVGDYLRTVLFKITEHHNQAYASRDSKSPPGPNLADSLLSMPYHG